jgi:hypothetical protein
MKNYVIGEEKDLKELIKESDLIPLFESAVRAGVSEVTIEDTEGNIICRCGNASGEEIVTIKKPVCLEGETIAYVVITTDTKRKSFVNPLGELIFNAVMIILQSRYRAALTMETHKTVVDQSYEELLEINKKLKLSENKYRELASSLEIQVQQRTEELKRAHAKLLQQEKMASIGQLAAGVAHEINNPLGFILSNINTLKQYVAKFKDVLLFYRTSIENRIPIERIREESKQRWERAKLDYVIADVEDLIRESVEGAKRVQKIVSDLKGFSHIDETNEIAVDINDEIDRTLNVLTHEIPEDAQIIKDYATLPPYTCNPAYICQVFFNIILNAVQARKESLKLIITTRRTNGSINISFTDNGPGIPGHIMPRIFEPFFTTKEVGKGTGMGLSVAYEIITSLGGNIEVESEVGRGTTFIISLPLPPRVNNVKVR